ncbi:MAG: DpnII family type II restriction endonuclease [Tissierella sp.]|uniref:DpnII family type II restriction endonuclease n=1 Tax=Tissierella sp. TaxID=41274 RepID=UPI003F9D42A8
MFKSNVKPFLKWAGGKTKLLPIINRELPEDIDNLTTYVEPFVGAGAVFFDFIYNDKFEKYIINDINSRLINVFLNIRDRVNDLIILLERLQESYLILEVDSKERDDFYYGIREKFNDDNISSLESSAYFIFLNKTCFNGLYRENKSGNFNVPTGRYKNPKVFVKEQLLEISKVLNKKDDKGNFVVTILNLNYSDLEEYIDSSTFVYFDPPYRPITKGGFSTYNKSGFNDTSQKELASFFSNVSNKGAKLMLSNSNPREYIKNDNFFEILYKDFNIKKLYASRVINSDGDNRKDTSELLITNYYKENNLYMGEDNMEYKSSVYSELLQLETVDKAFDSLINNLKPTIKGWDYFVNWDKVLGNIKSIERSLNTLNYLIGKDDIENEARELLSENPQIINVLPILIATRDNKFEIIEPNEDGSIIIKNINFGNKKTRKDDLTDEELDNAIEFLHKTNLFDLFADKTIKNLVDYVMGVEVGLDTNGRKNRTGDAMENILEKLITKMCKDNGWDYLYQATVATILEEWNIVVPTDKSKRRFDFVINKNGKILLGETNYYHGGGSKLKSVASEFTKLDKYIKEGGFKFCWVTDGLGWHTAKMPLRDAFDDMRCILNLDMVEKGALEYIVKNL